jgi:hypothetical protein
LMVGQPSCAARTAQRSSTHWHVLCTPRWIFYIYLINIIYDNTLSTLENYNKYIVKWWKKPLGKSSFCFIFKSIKVNTLF